MKKILLLILFLLLTLSACHFGSDDPSDTESADSEATTETGGFSEKLPSDILPPEGEPLGHFAYFPDRSGISDSLVGATASEKNKAKQWFASLIGSQQNLPVSFTIGTQSYHGFNDDFSVTKEDGCITACHKNSGLVIRFQYRFEEAYARSEWTLTFENTGSETSAVIRDIRVLDLSLTLSDPKLSYHTVYPNGTAGSLAKQEAFLRPGTNLSFRPAIGDGGYTLPFYDLRADTDGFLIALGWQGLWETAFDADFISVSSVKLGVTAGQASLATVLEPGETLITPLVSIFQYSDLTEGHSDEIYARWFADQAAASDANTPLTPDEPYTANLSAAPFAPWQSEAEASNRLGMTENQYVQGLYAAYDKLLDKDGYLPFDATAFARLDLYLLGLPLRLSLPS